MEKSTREYIRQSVEVGVQVQAWGVLWPSELCELFVYVDELEQTIEELKNAKTVKEPQSDNEEQIQKNSESISQIWAWILKNEMEGSQ